MKKLVSGACAVLFCAMASACAMSVGTDIISQAADGAFRIESRNTRDASYMWDDSQDEHAIWAVNNTNATGCVRFTSQSGYESYYLVAPYEEKRLMSFIHGGGSFSTVNTYDGACNASTFN